MSFLILPPEKPPFSLRKRHPGHSLSLGMVIEHSRGTMSEMLANYHFLTRDYASALTELQAVLRENPADAKARKKLVICLTQTGRIGEALDAFHRLIADDIRIITDTDAAWEDCPCPGLVRRLEQGMIARENACELNAELGMLWLYCDARASLNYFRRALACAPDCEVLSAVIHLIESHLYPPKEHHHVE